MSAIDAYFVSFSTSRDGSTLRLVFELPTERTADVMRVLGAPSKDGENWCAVAKLKPAPPEKAGATAPKAEKPGKDKTPWRDMKLVTRAAILCADPLFWEWVQVRDADSAATWVRSHCDITSRKELDTDAEAAGLYVGLERDFFAYKEEQARFGPHE